MNTKKFLVLIILSNIVVANPLGGDPANGYCQTVDGSACGWGGGSSSSRQVYKVPNRWGAIYFNPVNRAVGYSENNTKGYRSANKEALESCIRAGGGVNPIARDGKGCRLMSQYRNVCAAFAVGGDKEGSGGFGMINGDYLDDTKKEAMTTCSKYSNRCTIRYAGCSRHPDYLRY
ncbi:TPA: DUF4189 domain-containing protein [Neisseria oralis]|jgi:hypothetical protein